jgi:hypothetical protein
MAYTLTVDLYEVWEKKKRKNSYLKQLEFWAKRDQIEQQPQQAPPGC